MALQYLCLSPCFKTVGVQFTTRERIFMVKMFIETQDAPETKSRFQRRFPNRNLLHLEQSDVITRNT